MSNREKLFIAGDNLYRVSYRMSATGQAEFGKLVVAKDAGEAEKSVEHCFKIELIEDDISMLIHLDDSKDEGQGNSKWPHSNDLES